MEGASFSTQKYLRIIQINYVDISLSIFSFLDRTPLVLRLHLVGGLSTIRNRCAAGIGIHLLSATRLVRSTERTSGILYVHKPARHYTCVPTLSSWPYRGVFTD